MLWSIRGCIGRKEVLPPLTLSEAWSCMMRR